MTHRNQQKPKIYESVG